MQGLLSIKDSHKTTYVTGYSVFRVYCAVKAHMSGSYDISKYGLLNIKVSESSYQKRNDRVFFERLAKKLPLNECYQMLVFNLAANAETLSYELADSDAFDFYKQHVSIIQRMTYVFKEELSAVFNLLEEKEKNFSDLFIGTGHPVIIQLLLRKTISLETFLLLDSFLKIIPRVDNHCPDDIMWRSLKDRLVGYQKLLDINTTLARDLFLQVKSQY